MLTSPSLALRLVADLEIPVGWRVRAARALRNVTVDELAERIDQPGLGSRTLRKIEGGEREVKPMELNAIAEACDVPRSWFSVPFEWLDEAQVVSVDLLIPDDLGVQPRLGVELRELLAQFATSRGVRSVQELPREFSRTAYAVLERSGRLFWWTARETAVTFHFARPMPGGGPHRVDPSDEQLVRATALGDLLEAWLAAAVTSRDYARRLAEHRPSSPGDVDRQAVLSRHVETMDTFVEEVRAAVESIVQAVTSEASDSNG